MGFDDEELITEILISRGFMLTYKFEHKPTFTENTVYLASDGIKETYICVDNTLADSTVTMSVWYAVGSLWQYVLNLVLMC